MNGTDAIKDESTTSVPVPGLTKDTIDNGSNEINLYLFFVRSLIFILLGEKDPITTLTTPTSTIATTTTTTASTTTSESLLNWYRKAHGAGKLRNELELDSKALEATNAVCQSGFGKIGILFPKIVLSYFEKKLL